MSNFAIDTQGLRKEFGEKVAVADLTLQVQQGEIFGFLGPNGAGKTTSVKMLLGLTTPTSGRATLLNQPLGNRQARAHVGFLPEHFRFQEWLRADEFLDLHGKLYGMSSEARAAAIPDLLELVGLGKRAKTKLGAFSKGMLQRIGLAQTMLNSPKLVFLDEPTSGLDPLGRRLVRDIIHGLREEGTTVFLNSHLLGEVELTCDRVAFIREGVVVETLDLRDTSTEQVHVTLRVGQPTPDLLVALEQFGREVEMDDSRGRVSLTLPDESHLPGLAHWLIHNGHTLYELTPRTLSLEDRFMQIIGDHSGDT